MTTVKVHYRNPALGLQCVIELPLTAKLKAAMAGAGFVSLLFPDATITSPYVPMGVAFPGMGREQ